MNLQNERRWKTINLFTSWRKQGNIYGSEGSIISIRSKIEERWSALEEGLKYVLLKHRTQCIINLLQIIQKYEEKQSLIFTHTHTHTYTHTSTRIHIRAHTKYLFNILNSVLQKYSKFHVLLNAILNIRRTKKFWALNLIQPK